MSGGELLVMGKALIWFTIPLALAGWELWRLRRLRGARERARRRESGR